MAVNQPTAEIRVFNCIDSASSENTVTGAMKEYASTAVNILVLHCCHAITQTHTQAGRIPVTYLQHKYTINSHIMAEIMQVYTNSHVGWLVDCVVK